MSLVTFEKAQTSSAAPVAGQERIDVKTAEMQKRVQELFPESFDCYPRKVWERLAGKSDQEICDMALKISNTGLENPVKDMGLLEAVALISDNTPGQMWGLVPEILGGKYLEILAENFAGSYVDATLARLSSPMIIERTVHFNMD